MSVELVSRTSRKVIGTMDMRDGKLVGSNPGVQHLIDSFTKTFKGTQQKLYEAFAVGWSNGYLYTREGPAEQPAKPSEPGPAGIRYPAGTVRSSRTPG
jgi:hypothetical protein